MSVSTRAELLAHWGHALNVAYYGSYDDPESVTIECMDCREVLVDFDKSAENILETLGGPGPMALHIGATQMLEELAKNPQLTLMEVEASLTKEFNVVKVIVSHREPLEKLIPLARAEQIIRDAEAKAAKEAKDAKSKT